MKKKPVKRPSLQAAGPNVNGRSAKITGPSTSTKWLIALFAISVLACLGAGFRKWFSKPRATGAEAKRDTGLLTFNADVAPIIYQHCSYCHRPGQSAPFDLLSYADAKKRAKQIAEVTAKRYMPPWLPEPGYGEFSNVRQLSRDQLEVIQRWVTEGAAEGDAKDLPPAPKRAEGWHLGEPDLVVKLLQPHVLQAEGKDVYRNFVIPIPVATRRYVKAVEFQAGNPRVVHHAFINFDKTRESRRLAAKQNPPGFDGMKLPESASMVAGQMLGWQPGKLPEVAGDGLSWPLDTETDLVLQLHLHPSGKPEEVQPAVGFYFTEQPPTQTPFRLSLFQWKIDLPAGARDVPIENTFTLPADVEVLRVSPHAHYLAKDMQGYAILPNGTKQWLLWIKDWDFNWQGDYRYAKPIFLPKGSKMVMRYTYDNSTNNPHNPSQPPKRVRYGLETTDEMAELWFQVLPRDPQDLTTLRNDLFIKLTDDAISYNKSILEEKPGDARAHAKLGQVYLGRGRYSESLEHLHASLRFEPNDDKVHYDLGSVYLRQKQLAMAKEEFQTVLRLNPDDFQAEGSLGTVYWMLRDVTNAEVHFQRALRLNPADPVARRFLDSMDEAKRALQAR